MCDKGCLVDIKNIKEDYADIKCDLKELLVLIRNQDKIIANQEKRIALLEQIIHENEKRFGNLSNKAWQLIAGTLLGIIGVLIGKIT